jgi:hypothetical protein
MALSLDGTTGISATGNIVGNNIIVTNSLTAGSFSPGSVISTGNVTGGNLLTGGLVSATANVTGGNILTVGIMSSTGNAFHGNLTVSTGNIILGNIVNAGSNGAGNIGSSISYFNTGFLKSTTAQYADLAENYVADGTYRSGTVLVFGGNNEVTMCTVNADPRVAGVVSSNPAHLMNSTLDAEHTVALALQGRVLTNVTGTIRKGDMMVTASNGYAQACTTPAMGTVLGKALEDFDGIGMSGVIEIVVGRL